MTKTSIGQDGSDIIGTMADLVRRGTPERKAAARALLTDYYGPGGVLEKQGIMIGRRDPAVTRLEEGDSGSDQ